MVIWVALVGCAHFEHHKVQQSFELPDDGEIFVLEDRWLRNGEVLSSRVWWAARREGDVLWCRNAYEWRRWTMARLVGSPGSVLSPFDLAPGDCQAVWWGADPARVTVFGPGDGGTAGRIELVVDPEAFRSVNARIQEAFAVMATAR